MEIADVYVMNKSDRPGADKLRQEIEVMLGIRRGNAFRHMHAHHGATAGDGGGGRAKPDDAPWTPPVLATVATTGQGVPEVVAAFDRLRAVLGTTAAFAPGRRPRLAVAP